jgi:hypothetical protein
MRAQDMGVAGYMQFRPLMFSIAYRMTGSVSDGEDIVQEASSARGTTSTRANPGSRPHGSSATRSPADSSTRSTAATWAAC